MRAPKVSIGMPVYNGEKYLVEALHSLLVQDYLDFELIISDNASTDATGEICRGFAAKDARVRYYRNPTNIGAGPNFRKVFELARGEYFKWAAYDDIHLPGFLGRCVQVLESAPPSVAVVMSRTFFIDNSSQPVFVDEAGAPLAMERLNTCGKTPSERLAEVLPLLRYAPAQFGLFRVPVLRRTRGMDSFLASDLVLTAEIAMLGEIREIDLPLFAYRRHPAQSSVAHKTDREYNRWIGSPTRAKRPLLFIEYARSTMRLPALSPLERGRCFAVVAKTWLKRRMGKKKL